jgi:hypothetical protein
MAEFTEHFLRMYLPSSWIDRKYKPFLKEQLFNKQRTLMTNDMELVQFYLKSQSLEVQKNPHLCRSYKNSFENMLNNNLTTAKQSNIKQEPQVYKRPCTQETCRGFINENHADGWKCGLCNIVICKDCRSIKTLNHACDPQTLESIKTIQKETKPCPTCSEPIFKPFGCDHMFCTVCKANFSWKTGELIPESNQTNPLYKEYMAKLKSKSLANNSSSCGAPFDIHDSQRNWPFRYILPTNKTHPHEKNFYKLVNIWSIMKEMECFQVDFTNQNEFMKQDRKLRVEYLAKELDESKFIQKIYANHKKQEYFKEINNLVNVAKQVLIEWWVEFLTFLASMIRKNNLRDENMTDIDSDAYKIGLIDSKYSSVIGWDKTRNLPSYVPSFYNLIARQLIRTNNFIFFLDISSWEHLEKPLEVLNFLNKQSLELSKLYGYKTTHAVVEGKVNQYYFTCCSSSHVRTDLSINDFMF